MQAADVIAVVHRALEREGVVRVGGTEYGLTAAMSERRPGTLVEVLAARPAGAPVWTPVEPGPFGLSDLLVVDRHGRWQRASADAAVRVRAADDAPELIRALIDMHQERTSVRRSALTECLSCRPWRRRALPLGLNLAGSPAPATGDVGVLAAHLGTLREQDVRILAAGRAEAEALAVDVLAAMADRPARVAEFAGIGYTVGQADGRVGGVAMPVPVLLRRGVPVHAAGLRAAPMVPGAFDEAVLGCLRDVAALSSLIEPAVRVPLHNRRYAELLRRALDGRNARLPDGVAFEVRRATVIGAHGAAQECDVLFRVAPRDARLPAALAQPSIAEWPDGAVFVVSHPAHGAAAAAYGDELATASGASTAVDRTLAPSVAAALPAEATAVITTMLGVERARVDAMLSILRDAGAANPPVRAALAAVDARLPVVDATDPPERVVAAIEQLRRRVSSDLDGIVALAADDLGGVFVDLMSGDRTVYAAARARGYRVMNVDVDYVDAAGRVSVYGEALLARIDGRGTVLPLQSPPARASRDGGLHRAAGWPAPDPSVIRELAADMAACVLEARGVAPHRRAGRMLG